MNLKTISKILNKTEEKVGSKIKTPGRPWHLRGKESAAREGETRPIPIQEGVVAQSSEDREPQHRSLCPRARNHSC